MTALHFQKIRVVDPKSGRDEVCDVTVADGKFQEIGKRAKPPAQARIVDGRNKILAPGFLDLHVHLREPGREDKETIRTGLLAAARGGFTTILAMPNTNPVCDRGAVVEYILSRARKWGGARIFPVGAISKGLEGQELAEIGEMARAGIVAISDDGRGVQNGNLMRRAMEYATMFDLLVVAHEEDDHLAAKGVMNEGVVSTGLGLRGILAEAESVMVARDLALQRIADCRLHIAHVSSAQTVELIRQAKREKRPISCEVTPHHLLLTEEAVRGFDPVFKMNPPLRTEDDRQVLVKALRDGVIDCIATDHAPHSPHEKQVEFDSAPFGVIGMETAFAVLHTVLVSRGEIPLATLIERMTSSPARILGISEGQIAEGLPADLVVIDPHKQWTVGQDPFFSKSSNCPFVGWKLTGDVVMTIKEGQVVYESNPGA